MGATSYPPALRRLASELPRVSVNLRLEWSHVEARLGQASSPGELERRIAAQAADKLAHDLAGHFMARRKFEFWQDIQSLGVRVDVHAFSHDELLELLQRAFREGQSYAMQYGPKIQLSEEAFHKACQEMGKELGPR